MIRCWNATIMAMVLAVKTGGDDWCLDTDQSVVVTCLIGAIVGHYAYNMVSDGSCEIDLLTNTLGATHKLLLDVLFLGVKTLLPPFLLSYQKVHEGSIGAVTCKGLVSATLAGGMVGLTYELLGFLTADCSPQFGIIPICAFAGSLRSLLGSLLTIFSHRTTISDSSNEDCIEMQCRRVKGPVA